MLPFLQTLIDFYGKNPYGKGFTERLAPYCEDLDHEAQQSTARRLCERHKTFPKLADCIAALKNVQARLAAPISTDAKKWDAIEQIKAERLARKRACHLCKCDLGHRANREGWLVSLIDFATDEGRLPETEREIEKCIRRTRKAEHGLESLRGTPLYPNYVNLRKNMLERASIDVFG